MKEKLISDLNEMLTSSTTLKESERALFKVLVEYIKTLEDK